MDPITVISSVGLSGALSAGLLFLAKTWIGERVRRDIQHEYDSRLEMLKDKLTAQRSCEIERMRADFHIIAAERQIRFQGLYQQSAKAVTEIYSSLQHLQSAMGEYACPVLYLSRTRTWQEGSNQEEAKVHKAHDDLKKCWSERKIFVPQHLVDVLDKIVHLVVNKFVKCSLEMMKLEVWKAHQLGQDKFVQNFGRPLLGDKLDDVIKSNSPPIDPREFGKQFETIDEEIERNCEKLEQEFRTLLGFDFSDSMETKSDQSS